MSQRDEFWFAQRAGKFTGSRFSDLMALTKSGPSTSRKNLLATLAVERLTGKCVEAYRNTAMERGIALEEEARQAYEVRTSTLCVEVDFIPHPTLPFVGVSPDGVIGSHGLLEIKCQNAAKHIDALRASAHVNEYFWQLQGQLWVAGRDWVDATSYHPDFPPHIRLAITRVARDEDAIKKLEQACIDAELEVCAIVEELQSMRMAA